MDCGTKRRNPNMILVSPGDRYWGSGLLKWLEFVGYGTRKKRTIQKRRSTNLPIIKEDNKIKTVNKVASITSSMQQK